MIEKIKCRTCGKLFDPTREGTRRERYCSPECRRTAEQMQAYMSHRQKEEREFARREMKKVDTGKLDKRLKELKRSGTSYAEWQMQDTLEKSKAGYITMATKWRLERYVDNDWWPYGEFGTSESALSALAKTAAWLGSVGQCEVRVIKVDK